MENKETEKELRYEKTRGGYAVTGVGDCDRRDVEIPSEHNGRPVVRIAEDAFRECCGIESVTIPDTVTEIGRGAFAWSSLKSVTIPGSVRAMGFKAFEGCELDSVDIGDMASWCAISFTGPDSNPLRRARMILVGGKEAYNLVIPDGVERIGGYAFYGCRAVMSVTLPGSLREIKGDAFRGCCGLSVVCNRSDIAMTADAGEKKNGFVAYYAKRIAPADEAEKVLSYRRFERDGYVFYDTGDEMYLTGCLEDRPYMCLPKIEGRGYEIGPDAFSESENLREVDMPRSVTAIGRAAFYGCKSLHEVGIGNGVRRIGDFAFEDCFNLERVDFGRSVERIGDYTFRGCTCLRRADLPEGLTYIGERAFNKCFALGEFTIPRSVEYMGECAFQELNWNKPVTVFCGCSEEKLLSLVRGKDCLECMNGQIVFPDGRRESVKRFQRCPY